MAIKIHGKSKNFQASQVGARKVTLDQEYDLSNISTINENYSSSQYSTLTIGNFVNRAGAAVDDRSVFEKAHSNGSGRYTVTIPFDENNPEQLKLVQIVSDTLEDVFRSELQKFSKEHSISADRDTLIRSEAYRRAKRDATYERDFTEEERDRRIGHLMPKKKNAGRIDLQIRMSVRDNRYMKANSTAWRETEVGMVGTYNAFGVGSLPLFNKNQLDDALALSQRYAQAIIPVIAGQEDLNKIWTSLADAVAKLKVAPGYDRLANTGFTEKEEIQIEEIKAEMLSALIS